MTTFDEKTLVSSLRPLPLLGQAAFAASSATRLFRAYLRFHEQTGLGDPVALRTALECVWDWVSGHRRDQAFYEQQLGLVMNLIQKESGPWTALHAYAEDVTAAVSYALRTILNNDPQEAAWAARRVYEALDHYIVTTKAIDINSPDAEREIASEPLIQAEISRQKRDIQELKAIGSLNASVFVERFKTRADAEQAIPGLI